jgi:type I restriction enzyme M protein
MVWREVLPCATGAEIDESNTRTGCEISFTRCFYRSPLLRTLEEICADIEALERETEGLSDEILEEVNLE